MFAMMIFASGIAPTAIAVETVSDRDLEYFHASNLEYSVCLGSTTVRAMGSSSDPEQVVRQVLDYCESYLSRLEKLIVDRGYSSTVAKNYVDDARASGEEMVTSHLKNSMQSEPVGGYQ